MIILYLCIYVSKIWDEQNGARSEFLAMLF